MEMKDIIAKWFAWLKQAASTEDEQLSPLMAHYHKENRQLPL